MDDSQTAIKMALPLPAEGQRRVLIENVKPAVDQGRYAVKRQLDETAIITADAFADGHDLVRVQLQSHHPNESNWQQIEMQPLGNDAWQAEFSLDQLGLHEFCLIAWVDHFQTWLRDLKKRIEAEQDIVVELLIGAKFVAEALARADGDDVRHLQAWHSVLSSGLEAVGKLQGSGCDDLAELMAAHPDLRYATKLEPVHTIMVDREQAHYSTWYELFPRSTSPEAGRHGTFKDVIARLPYVAEMGFDVLYMPPIHPIGAAFRKGKNNSVTAEPNEPGSPWAIGFGSGGHKGLLAELGTPHDFQALIQAAKELGIELAMDIAYQCSPDHPYASEHQNWFKVRPDGSIQYAENPPKKYQDIYPFDFESEDWQGLWQELQSVIEYWCQQGVRIFRVDNPHTKALPFWGWMITNIKLQYPDTIFLSEAFTRPKIMYALAKLGFSQSYTYFTWRNNKAEFIEYFTELTQPALQDYFRPNLWPNTPDILPPHLQSGNPAAFKARLVLAATLGACYGIYGPAYELLEHEPLKPGSEEYLNSEKYEARVWDLNDPKSLRDFIAVVNRTRRQQAALQADKNLVFHETDNDQLLCYSKRDDHWQSRVLVVVNLNFDSEQHGFITIDAAQLGLDVNQPYQLHDVLTGNTFTWTGVRNYVELDPQIGNVAHVLIVTQ